MPVLYSIGYGGRKPSELIEALNEYQIHWVVDVRLMPRAFIEYFCAGEGMRNLLEPAIGYRWMQELGNVFRDDPQWKGKYTHRLYRNGDIAYKALKLLVDKLEFVSWTRVCLLCAERKAQECHRSIVAKAAVSELNSMKHTQTKWEVIHIE